MIVPSSGLLGGLDYWTVDRVGVPWKLLSRESPRSGCFIPDPFNPLTLKTSGKAPDTARASNGPDIWAPRRVFLQKNLQTW